MHYDERHAIWILWYTAQAIAGRVSWPYTDHLLSPHGISVLVDGVGPLNGILALAFWPWGAAAAFNGAALLGLGLSGWCLYGLARDVGLRRGPAFVAGALFMLWPIHLIALTGHLEKLFIGMLPLTLRAGLRAFDPQRHRAWLMAPGAALLGALLQNGNQFVFAAMGIVLVGIQTCLAAPPAERAQRCRRMLLSAAFSMATCGPLLLAIARVMRDPTLHVVLGDESKYYSPDALSLFLPAPHQRWAAWLFPSAMHTFNYAWESTLPGLNPSATWYGTGLETAIAIPLVALALCACAWRDRAARRWVLFGACFAVLCLGSRLRLNGHATGLPMPYGVLKRTPGFNVMRTPGRFMLLGSVGFALGAGVGLATLAKRFPRHGHLVVVAVSGVALAECWPRPWPQSALPPVPEFYRQLASAPGQGAVFDLPHGWSPYNGRSSAYMYYQTFHGRPIAWSYLSRYHLRYPNPDLESIWEAAAPAGRALRARLNALGYRYVVFHKFEGMFGGGQVSSGHVAQPRGSPASPQSDPFIRDAFRGEAPAYEDPLVVVYAID